MLLCEPSGAEWGVGAVSKTSVKEHLLELLQENPDHYEMVQGVREIVRAIAPDTAESVMYGGILFAAPTQFCGVFAYTRHVSVEFSQGHELADPFGVLEGKGKLRRHIKLLSGEDLEAKHVRDYIARAHGGMLPR
jgi:hypothetical protein